MQNKMDNPEAIDMMVRAIADIQSLRSEVARLKPKADAYDSISIILNLLPKPSQGYGEDLVWRLQKRIKELQEVPNDAKPV